MTLHLHRAPRTDQLADALGDLLTVPLDDPFAQELVLVPAAGIERWLSQRLSHRLGRGPSGDGVGDAVEGADDGVCAGVEFRSPRSLVATLLGAERDDPWSPDALAWPVLEVLDTRLDEPWAATLARHLGSHHEGEEREFRRGRRYSVARRLAGLLASYAAQRPQLLADWSDHAATDGLGEPLDDDLAWQPPLWRAVREQVDAPSPQERQASTLQRLREGPIDLPARVSLFGHTRLPRSEIDLLVALAEHHELHLWLPHPSARLWTTLAETLPDDDARTVARADDRSHRLVGHPLSATLGRDLRELQRALPSTGTAGVVDVSHEPEVGGGRRGGDGGAEPDTLLGWLQSDLRADEVRPAGRTLAASDRSVQVHRCHGASRQVDVLREVLLGLLADDPTLEPRDILVMCPDIETYAPLITARFGLADVVSGGHPAHRLRVQLADRAVSRTNPLLGVAEQLLAVAGSRAQASLVLDLAQDPAVRRRFGFSDDDLDALTTWTRESGIRWGFDAEHRAPYGVDYVQNTWRFGLDRVLAGVALSDDAAGWIGATLPLDDVGSNRVELAGRFAELVDRLVSITDGLTGTRPLREWITTLVDGVTSLTTVAHADSWQVGHLQRELRTVLAQADARDTTALRLPDVRALLAGRLAGRPTRASFRTGTLTVCTMVPMRSVPHRVVCMVGLDDGVFPRFGAQDGDDVLARTPVTGERDVRSEDRQLLLDAIGAASETLVVTYTGANEHSGQPRPPAVPLGELLDVLDRTTEQAVRAQVVVSHPLQPFDARNVVPGALGVPGSPFTFDPTMLVAARAAVSSRPTRPDFLARPLPAPPGDDVALADLVAFFKDPVKGFFRALDVTLPWETDGLVDAMPIEIDELESWGVGDRMLADMLRLVHPDDARQAEWRRGHLPPGRLGWRKAGAVRDSAAALAFAALTHRQVPARAHDIDVTLSDGRRLTGTVSPVYGDRVVAVGYSKLAGKHLLEAWVRLLALAAHDDDHNWTALAIGRPPRGTVPAQRLLAPGGDGPLSLLEDLVALYDAGRRAPLPLPLKTSYAWAVNQRAGDDAAAAAAKKWRSAMYPGEDADPGQVRVWGPHAPLDRLLEPGPLGPDFTLPVLAERLWLPLLDNERSL
ncbi:exodeoxyribonuclease V subunit gamma [Nocardioides sp.]|uniref:exodeoxyribonuclease V subunit gamma n=1 Tax=Nocardioides sp. TaxID=35761 RepID=UPI002B269D40|nr:exodeoxyribonuclease V subunit gamma [Nocardioides sp.]